MKTNRRISNRRKRRAIPRSIVECRKMYRRIRERLLWVTAENVKQVQARIELMLSPAARQRKNGPTPADWIKAARRTKVPCARCAGTGRYITRVENGQPKGPGGMCFRCRGDGFQMLRDTYRNESYDKIAAARAA